MVLLLDGTSKMMRMSVGKHFFSLNIFKFSTASTLTDALKNRNNDCAPVSKLPSNISTMSYTGFETVSYKINIAGIIFILIIWYQVTHLGSTINDESVVRAYGRVQVEGRECTVLRIVKGTDRDGLQSVLLRSQIVPDLQIPENRWVETSGVFSI